MKAKTNRVDMVNGPLWGKILKFAAVFMLTSLLQHLYSAADTIVVGRFAGEEALAGVGTCGVIINLFLSFIVKHKLLIEVSLASKIEYLYLFKVLSTFIK